MLEGLPLALDQAGAYIEETGCSIAAYLQRYTYSRHQLLARRGIASAGDHPASVTTTVRLAIKQLERVDPAAEEVLRACAFLHPDAIPEEVLVRGAPHLGPVLESVNADPTRRDQAMAALRRFSLVSRHAETHTLSAHRLVQAVVQDDLDPAARQLWSGRVLRAVNATLPQVDFVTWAESERCLPHALLCIARLEQEKAALPEVTDVLFKTGSYLLERGRYGEAEPLLAQAVASGEMQHGTDHPLLIPYLVGLGTLWHKRGNYDLARRRCFALWRWRSGTSPLHIRTRRRR
jgi:hypothetical protein